MGEENSRYPPHPFSLVADDTKNYLLGLAAVAAMFMAVSYFAEANQQWLKSLIYRHEQAGVFVYIFLAALATVIAPFSVLPFLPLVSFLYGWFWAGVWSIIGWTIGAYIAFEFARTYGRALVQKFVSLAALERFEARMPRTRVFWSVVVLRMLVPVDLLSYALGLFSRMSASTYLAATIIGITPFAFVWAYAGSFSWKYLMAALGAMLGAYFFLQWRRK